MGNIPKYLLVNKRRIVISHGVDNPGHLHDGKVNLVAHLTKFIKF